MLIRQREMIIPLTCVVAFTLLLSNCADGPKQKPVKEKVSQDESTRQITPAAEPSKEHPYYTDPEYREKLRNLNPNLSLEKECGLANPQKPDAVSVDKRLVSSPIKKIGKRFLIDYEVTLAGKVHVVGSTVQSEVDTALEVTDVRASLFVDIIRATAKADAAAKSGHKTFTFVPPADRATKLVGAPGWANILCAVLPSEKIDVKPNSGEPYSVTFKPPLPASLSPKASYGRYQEELSRGATFTNITATRSNGVTANGSATITPITQRKLVVTRPDGTGLSIEADVAFRVAYDFGANTESFGLFPLQDVYIRNSDDITKRDLLVLRVYMKDDLIDGQPKEETGITFTGE